MKKKVSSESEILGMIVRIQEQIAALDKKVDALISKPMVTTNSAPAAAKPPMSEQSNTQAQGNSRSNSQPKSRPMFRAICADCQKECEVPFKPTGERPVYCKECFRLRKSGNKGQAPQVNKNEETPVLNAVIHAGIGMVDLPTEVKKKTPPAKKAAVKKKPAAKKKKK